MSGPIRLTSDLPDRRVPPAPPRETIAGRFARLEPLDPRAHGADLRAHFAKDDAIWRYMAYGPFPGDDDFRRWLDTRAEPADPLTFAIVDAASGRATGLLALMAIRPDQGVVEIGNVVLSPALRRTTAATEAICLALKRVFALGYRRVEWKCDARNVASKNAAKRFGFQFEGLFRQHMIVKGENRDTAWFAMLDCEWPDRETAFEGWLAPRNFDSAGRQIRPLVSFEPPEKLGYGLG